MSAPPGAAGRPGTAGSPGRPGAAGRAGRPGTLRARLSAVRLRPSAISLRSRLVLLSLLLVLLGLAVSDTVVLGSVRGRLEQRVDQQLQRYGQPLAQRLGTDGIPAPRFIRSNGTGGGTRPWLPSQFVVAFAAADGRVSDQFRLPVAAGDPRPLWPSMDATALRSHLDKPFDVSSDHGGGSWRVLIVPVSVPAGDSSGAVTRNGTAVSALPAGVVVAASLDDVASTTSRLSTGFLLIGAVVAALLGVAAWFAIRAGLRPLRQIEATAAEIAAGRPLSHRMPAASPRTETGRLSSALNGMLAQIESAFAARAASEEQMRRFVADASHELRTPLAGIRGFAELYRMGALPDEADVRRTMARIESEAVRLGGLVEDLLTLVRMDEQRPVQLAPMDLRTLAVDALHDTTALDPSRAVSLTGPGGPGTPPGPALVLGDEARLRQVVANLVGNAVAHTPPGTPVRIGVGTLAGHGVLEVADAGPGLTPDQAARVFERFYRVDASRSRQRGGGAGLGLSIAAALISAHRGHVELDTTPGRGATFRVRLPSARQP
ncbi:two-component system, OmpR family, sensor kinase [Streptomyces sp. DvalAA-14]|uniref:ATP-binding protein n=1 Tax=unclassified Streptomyces TaxID=2593676 RepID=UPI00081B4C3D|nr:MULTISPECIES: ATP-binding protein [unclassified Streptomyces]MYS24087.1 HAMP domain-containing protein [Streptomyces sp. SID4948]SCE42502.1 two-component system, OmpR family, sensor kinase [Streptomyces sp. DvalAA-14]